MSSSPVDDPAELHLALGFIFVGEGLGHQEVVGDGSRASEGGVGDEPRVLDGGDQLPGVEVDDPAAGLVLQRVLRLVVTEGRLDEGQEADRVDGLDQLARPQGGDGVPGGDVDDERHPVIDRG